MCIFGVAFVTGLIGVRSASAAEPWWRVSSNSVPTDLRLGGNGTIVVSVANLGDGPVEAAGDPVKITDILPKGLEATGVEGLAGTLGVREEFTCNASTLACVFTGILPPFEQLEIVISVRVISDASGEINAVSVVGGGAPAVANEQQISISDGQTPFGVAQYGVWPEEEGGSPDTQAGSHPFQTTFSLALNQSDEPTRPPALVKDLRINLPPGLVGNPTPFPQCGYTAFVTTAAFMDRCPASTVIGVASVTIYEPAFFPATLTIPVPVFNLTPAFGEPARFGFSVLSVPVVMNTSVRAGGSYNVTTSVDNLNEEDVLLSSRVTLWGVPGARAHDVSRGWGCVDILDEECAGPELSISAPFLSLPTACAGPLQTSVEADSWAHPGVFQSATPGEPLTSLDGCDRLDFHPEIKVAPEMESASTSTGLTVDEHVPQEPILNPDGIATSDVKGLSVELPEGVTLNPAGADGLEACSLAQVGLRSGETPLCPDASKVATVTIKTPLLPDPLEGAVYLAAQDMNPFGSLVAMYLFAEDPTAGIRVKAAGKVVENMETGQLNAYFERDPVFEEESEASQFLPQLPFEDIEVHFFGGDRAPLSTPPRCGDYRTRGSFTPWSGNAPTESSSEFEITSGPDGTSCPNPLPFAPTLTGGTTNIQAAGFSPFTMTMSREDGNQNLQSIQLHMPPGLLGTLSNVKLCEEPQADAGSCGPESLIGHTTVSVGLGGDPYTVTGGQVFLTGPYEGAPFGLSIAEPAKAGPFDLAKGTPCDCVVVRAKIEVNPQTAALTVTTDSEGPYKIPQILQGIPLQIKHVNVTVDRSDFTFNPTDCDPLAISGTLASTEGATSSLKVPFQVTDCATLAFEPKFSVSSSGHTSRADGASLDVKLSYPNTAQGTETNIAKVKVQLPKRLPSRLKTLQKACTEKVFAENPASCPAASRVGEATAKTPVLPVELSGPAYFVSHGGAKFPELVVVLQGDNVTVQLHGETFISKKGITTSTFATVPDVPVSSFELKLPEGPYSALAANGNLCKGTLTIPTEFIAQDGEKLTQSTKIKITGCPKKVHHKARKKGSNKK
jgi:hypothetical protein